MDVLIHFIDHTAKIIRVNYIIAGINEQTLTGLHKMFSRRPSVERRKINERLRSLARQTSRDDLD